MIRRPWAKRGGDRLVDRQVALVRLSHSADAEEWASRIHRRLVRITTVTRLEVGFSARSADELRAGVGRSPLAAMPIEYMTPATEDRAVTVPTALTDRGQHRAPSIPDLLNYELIAEVTGQVVEQLRLK